MNSQSQLKPTKKKQKSMLKLLKQKSVVALPIHIIVLGFLLSKESCQDFSKKLLISFYDQYFLSN